MPIKPDQGEAGLNVYGVRKDRLVVLYEFDQTSGTTVTNLVDGVSPYGSLDFNGEIATLALDDTTEIVTTYTPTTDLWASDANEGQYFESGVDGPSASDYEHWIRFLRRQNGDDHIHFPEGALAIRFFTTDTSDNTSPLFNSGGIGTTEPWFRLFKNEAGGTYQLRVLFRWFINPANPDAGTRSVRLEHTIGDLTAWQSFVNSWHTWVVNWGPNGLTSYVDNVLYDGDNSTSAATDPTTLKAFVTFNSAIQDSNDRYARIANEDEPTQLNADTKYRISTFAMWDKQLTRDQIHEIHADPHNNIRNVPQTEFWTVQPMVGRPTQTSATIRVTTRNAAESTLYVRALYSTNADVSSSSTSQVISTSGANTAVDLILGNTDSGEQTVDPNGALTAGTTYYYLLQWSTDNFSSDVQTFPSGRGRFVTQPSNSSTDFSFVILSDDHITNSGVGGVPNSTGFGDAGYGIDLKREASSSNERRKWYANWRTMHDVYKNAGDIDFIIHGGDYVMFDANSDDATNRPSSQGAPATYKAGNAEWEDTPDDYLQRAAAWRNYMNLLSKKCSMFMVHGNHEQECGYLQHSDQGNHGPKQKQSTIVRKRFWVNPTNSTYPEGGETNSYDDWIPTGANYDSDYIFDYILEEGSSYGATYDKDDVASENSENASPLENYYAFTWSNTLFVVLDSCRYTDPGDQEGGPNTNLLGVTPTIGAGGSHQRWGKQWILGTTQRQCLRSTLRNSSAQWKVIISHNLFGGESIGVVSNYDDDDKTYGRGSGRDLTTDDELFILNLCKENNVTTWVKGHDHKFCHVINDGLNIVTIPTMGAPSHTTASNLGWHFTEIQDSYGTAESLGDLNSSGVSLSKVERHYNAVGYLKVDVTSESFTVNFVQTYVGVDKDTLEVPIHIERFVGERETQDSSAHVVVANTPEEVVWAVDADLVDYTLDDDWYSTINVSNTDIYSEPGFTTHSVEETYDSDNRVPLNEFVDEVAVAYVPRTLYAQGFSNASGGSNSGGGGGRPRARRLRIRQTTQSTVSQVQKKVQTDITLGADDPNVSSATQTHYEIYEDSAPVANGNPLLSLKSGSTLRENGNLLGLTKTKLSVILRPNTVYKVRFRWLQSGVWTNWTGVTRFRTRDLNYKHKKGSRQETVVDLQTVTETRRGATVVNNASPIRETRTRRGATIINPD